MNNKTHFAAGIALVLLVIGYIIMQFKNFSDQAEIFRNQAYSVGTVTKFYGPGKNASTVINYEFRIRGVLYINGYTAGIFHIPDKGIKEGDRFVVIYDSTDYDANLMLTDLPVKNDSDFKFYLKRFKKKPLDVSYYYHGMISDLYFLYWKIFK